MVEVEFWCSTFGIVVESDGSNAMDFFSGVGFGIAEVKGQPFRIAVQVAMVSYEIASAILGRSIIGAAI